MAMLAQLEIDPDMSIDHVMRSWPQTINVILDYKMHCIGCPLAPFHTPINVAVEHSVDSEAFITALNVALNN